MWVIFLGWAALAVIGVTVIGSVAAMIANKVRLKMLKDNKEAEKDMKEEKRISWINCSGSNCRRSFRSKVL